MLFGRTTANQPSRFLREAGLIEEDNIRDRSPIVGKQNTYFHYRETAQKPIRSQPGVNPASAPTLKLDVGLRIRHTAFGEGTVVKLTPMGGDQLLEIEFDEIGRKKLMYRAALKFISIL